MTAISDQLPLTAKASIFYNSEIYPNAYSTRGATRVKNFLRKLALNSVITKNTDYSIAGNKINLFTLESVPQKPVFSAKIDAKYFFMEPNYLKEFLKATEGAEVFCDVGGYHGFYSLVSNSEKSIVFEADPINSKHLRNNLYLNDSRDIEFFEKAVWSSDGSVKFDVEATGTSKISDNGVVRDSVSIDSFFKDREDPDVIKIDVEGAEGHVLEGAEQVLERSHPTLFIELHFDGRLETFGRSFSELKNYLKNLGYRFSLLDERGDERLVMAK